jgi:hypothetical protein
MSLSKSKVFGAAIVFGLAGVATASDLEDLAKDGYAVIIETEVEGEFEGCDFDKRIPFQNGMIFVCSEYNYTYAYNPDVLILKHVSSGDIKVIIDDEEFDGTVYRR